MLRKRERLKEKERIVIKIGSSSLAGDTECGLNTKRIERLVEVLAHLKKSGKDVCLVSSGSIATGESIISAFGGWQGDKDLAYKQACAAVGQAQLISIYNRSFAKYGEVSAQILLTEMNLRIEEARKNILNAINQLFKMGIVPIINENDTISTEEIKQVHTFGDNDRLSALVATEINADLLVILSDIEGMYTDDPNKNPEAVLIYEVCGVSDEHLKMAKGTIEGGVGTGGMESKLKAADYASKQGVDVAVINGDDPYNIKKLLEGERIGTLFAAEGKGDA